MIQLSNNTLADQLRNGERSMDLLYKNCFSAVAKYILQHNGQKQDAEDIFQEALIVLLQQLKQSSFVPATDRTAKETTQPSLNNLIASKPYPIAAPERNATAIIIVSDNSSFVAPSAFAFAVCRSRQ